MKLPKYLTGKKKHILDSGAFALIGRAMKKGGIDFSGFDSVEFWEYADSYAQFIKRHSDAIDYYANIDVIYDPVRTWMNQFYFEREHGLRPLSVIHVGTSPEWIDKYIERGYDYIGFGGIAKGILKDGVTRWLNTMFDHICPPPSHLPTIKVHGFGVGNINHILDYPWYCMTEEDHTVLTRDGWKCLSEIQVGTEILCYDNGKSQWEEIQELPTFDVVDAPIVHLKNQKIKGVEAFVSHNHRWKVTDRTHQVFSTTNTEGLNSGNCIPRIGTYQNFPDKKTYSDAYVELVAWFWTEGSIRKQLRYKKQSIAIYQSLRKNPENVRRIEKCLSQLGEKHCKSISNRDGCCQFELYGANRDRLLDEFPNKQLSYQFLLSLTKEQLQLFIDVSILADGNRQKMVASENDHCYLAQRDEKNIHHFRFACILAGYTTSFAITKAGMFMVRLCKTLSTEFAWCHKIQKEELLYTGRLWCVRVHSGAFFTKCNECVYVTGNSIDSTTWVKMAFYGQIHVPNERNGVFRWDLGSYRLFTDAVSPYTARDSDSAFVKPKHYQSFSKQQQKTVLRWLKLISIPFGRTKKSGKVIEPGVSNDQDMRQAANIMYYEWLQDNIPAWPRPFVLKHKPRRKLMEV